MGLLLLQPGAADATTSTTLALLLVLLVNSTTLSVSTCHDYFLHCSAVKISSKRLFITIISFK